MLRIVVLAAALAALAPATASAGSPILAPGAKVAGRTAARWSETFYHRFFTLPAAEAPFAGGSADPCLHPVRRLLIFGGGTTSECVVTADTRVLLGVFGGECSDVEEPPFQGATATARLACAKAFVDGVSALSLTVDGRAVKHLFRHRGATRDMTLDMQEGNVLGVAAGPVHSTADGYQVFLRPLAPGRHKIEASGTAGSGADATNLRVAFTLRVVRRHRVSVGAGSHHSSGWGGRR